MLKKDSYVAKLCICLTALVITPMSSASNSDNWSDKLSLSGMVKVDLIHDFASPNDDRINYRNILVQRGAEEDQSRIHARQSRIRLSYDDKRASLPIELVLEGDFFGSKPSGSETISNSSSFRIRHAYMRYNSWLAGQTWSNYVDVIAFPETLDFSNDTGQAFVRQGILSYRHNLDRLVLSYSIENPETDVYVSQDVEATIIDPLFDVTARARYQGKWGHVSLQAVARKFEVRAQNESLSELGYGLGVSGKVALDQSQTIKFHYSLGKGIGRYIQEVAGLAGVVHQGSQLPENNQVLLDLLNAKGGYFGYQCLISPSVRANISAGFIDVDIDPLAGQISDDDVANKLRSVHINLIWRIQNNLSIGIEHSVAHADSISNLSGKVQRLQLSAFYKF